MAENAHFQHNVRWKPSSETRHVLWWKEHGALTLTKKIADRIRVEVGLKPSVLLIPVYVDP